MSVRPQFLNLILAVSFVCSPMARADGLQLDAMAKPKPWSLHPLQEPSLPTVQNTAWAASPIDQFVLAKLEANHLAPAVRAEKFTLLRRVCFDLTGLPPTMAQQARFFLDESPNAFAKVVDELLDSPQYGEHWARHWLDVARYADTAGESADYPIPQAWRYRNWVIEAMNADLPYDEFLRQQIAGDLLPAGSDADKISKTVATGFLALSRRFSVEPDGEMHLTIEDTMDTLSKATMGISLSCARCHDHKFDPISSEDYYALYGIFSSTRYPYPGSENKKRPRDLVPLISEAELEKTMAPFKQEATPIDDALVDLVTERDALVALKRGETPAFTPTKTFEEVRDQMTALRDRRDKIMDRAPVMPMAYAVAEAKKPSDAQIQNRGEPYNRGATVPRGFLKMLGGQRLPNEEKGSGRLELAQWITDPHNPLTARVMVNRVWQHHFGHGIVATTNDFGAKGQPPTHPELLDWLALRFMEDGWSIKKLHRRILLSTTYQQSSQGSVQATQSDPANQFLSHFPRRRLDAEAIRDAMLFVSGNLDSDPGEGHPFPPQKEWTFTQHAPFTAVYPTNKRSIYLMQQRIRKHPFLAVFDGADTNASTGTRQLSTTPLQALFMMNDAFTHEQAEALAQRMLDCSSDPVQRINVGHRLVFGRSASNEETQRLLAWLERVKATLPATSTEKIVWSSYSRVILSSNEFIYLD